MAPFSVEQFLDVFGRYNSDLPNVAIVGSVIGVSAAAVVFARDLRVRRLAGIALSILWAWAGIVYQIGYFSEINNLAYLFGTLFIIQAVLLLYLGVVRRELEFDFRPDISGLAGGAFIFYSIGIYPLLGSLFGQAYPRMPTFGVPCPVTIFTFGLFMWNRRPLSWRLLAIPLLWTMIGSTATFLFGIWEDSVMLAAAGALIYLHRRKAGRSVV